MKQVYLAEDIRLANRQCALAEMLDAFADPDMQRKAAMAFHREAEMLAALDNPHIPRVYDNFSEQNRHYLVMEYVEGTTLEEKLALSGGRLAEDAVTDIGLQTAGALEYLHGLKPPIVYRDLKPSNVMVTADGLVRLIDFGIARYFQPLKTATAIGSQGYAAPEQYKGKAEVRSDIYALGATMHHLLTGRDPAVEPPFSFPPVEQLRPTCNPALASLINEALAYQPDERPASAAEFRQLLLVAKGELPWPTAPASRVEHSGVPWRQRAGLYALAFFGYTFINALFHAFWHSGDPLWLLVFKLVASFAFTLALVEALVFSWRRFRARQPGSGASLRFTWRHHAGLLALACLGYDMMVVVAFLLGRAKISLGNPVVTAFILTVVDTVAIVEGFIAFCGAGQRAGREAGAQLLTAASPRATAPNGIRRGGTPRSRVSLVGWILVGVFGLLYTGVVASVLLQLNSVHRSKTVTPTFEPKVSRSREETTTPDASINFSTPSEELGKEHQIIITDDSPATLWEVDLDLAEAYVVAWNAGSAAKAIAECKEVLAQDPSSLRAELILGTAYLSIGDTSAARTAFQKTAKLAGDKKGWAAVEQLAYLNRNRAPRERLTSIDRLLAALEAEKARNMAASAPTAPAQETAQRGRQDSPSGTPRKLPR